MPCDPTPLVVTSKGTMVIARRVNRSRVTRNVSMFRSLPYEPLQSDVEGDVDDDSGTKATLPTADPKSGKRRSRSVSREDRHVFASRRNACLNPYRHYRAHFTMPLVFRIVSLTITGPLLVNNISLSTCIYTSKADMHHNSNRCRPFWKMAATSIRGWIWDAPISKSVHNNYDSLLYSVPNVVLSSQNAEFGWNIGLTCRTSTAKMLEWRIDCRKIVTYPVKENWWYART